MPSASINWGTFLLQWKITYYISIHNIVNNIYFYSSENTRATAKTTETLYNKVESKQALEKIITAIKTKFQRASFVALKKDSSKQEVLLGNPEFKARKVWTINNLLCSEETGICMRKSS